MKRIAPWFLLVAACGAEPSVTESDHALVFAPVPEVPAVTRDVHLMEGNAFVYPAIPPYRTSVDGRVALSLKKVGGAVKFGLYAPETLATPWNEAAPGVRGLLASSASLANASFYAGAYAPNGTGPLDTTDHRTICDAWPVADPVENPYPCADDASADCYDLTVVSTYRQAPGFVQLHGKPIRVKVTSPKTLAAAITVDLNPPGAPAVAAGPPLVGDFGLEPMVTADGRLLVMRLGDVVTTNPVTGVPNTIYDLVYLVSDPEAPPCDVAAWDQWHPVSHAHHDVANAMPDRYGFAAYPLRDATGATYADGEDLGGSYPWIDRDGDNLFFTLISSQLWYEDPYNPGVVDRRYPTGCVVAGCTDPPTVGDLADFENAEQFRGFAFAGLWSRGKTVMLDSLVNNTDYGLGRTDGEQRMLELYTAGGAPVSWRVEMGRANGGAVPAGAVDNSQILDSLENLFNHDQDARPATVRDVVWTINTGKATAELAFDDYLDADAIVISTGNAATRKQPAWTGPTPASSTNQPTYYDGFTQTAMREAYFTTEAELENAATPIASRWATPPTGVIGGNLRIEPIAMGGLVGKGLWLAGNGSVLTYAMPTQVAGPSERTVSILLDPRFENDGATRALFTLPDGTAVDLIGLDKVRYKRNGFAVTVSMAGHPLVAGAWNHLAWVITADGNAIDLYRDGYKYRSTILANNRQMWDAVPATAGLFHIGGELGPAGLRACPATETCEELVAWIDDVKVFARALTPEHLCNLGHGTLVQLTAGADPTWDAIAGKYTTHGALRTLLGAPAGTKFACFHDYQNPERALLRHLPAGATSIRDEVNFPEGPLAAGSPRPDSSNNAFCLSCHVDDGLAPPSLSPAALALDTGGVGGVARPAVDDPRRQPMQPPPLIRGNVPADFFVTADPDSLGNAAFTAPAAGTPVDPYVIP